MKAFEAVGNDFCAYLVALAALQSGLRVQFIRDPHAIKGHSFYAHEYTGSVFTVSDGTTTHVFSRTRGSLTTAEAAALMNDKAAAKEILVASGINCPRGIRIDKRAALQNSGLFSNLNMSRCVVKPLSGSRGDGVVLGVDSQESLTAALRAQEELVRVVVIEEYVEGDEFRYFVAGEKVVAVTKRIPPNVVGDGIHTIAELVEIKNEQRRFNPHLSNRPILLGSRAALELKKQGIESLNFIPQTSHRVYLGGSSNLSGGGDSEDVTDSASMEAKRIAVAAAEALGAPNCGVDIIVSPTTGGEHYYVIEVNQRAQIGSHTFPMLGQGQRNRPAEEIIKTYFPETSVTHPHVYFSFMHVQRALKRGWAGVVTLPCLAGTRHESFTAMTEASLGAAQLRTLRRIFMSGRCLGRVTRADYGTLNFEVIGPPHNMAEVREQMSRCLGLSSFVTFPASDCDAAVSLFDLYYCPSLTFSVTSFKRSLKRVAISLLSES